MLITYFITDGLVVMKAFAYWDAHIRSKKIKKLEPPSVSALLTSHLLIYITFAFLLCASSLSWTANQSDLSQLA